MIDKNEAIATNVDGIKSEGLRSVCGRVAVRKYTYAVPSFIHEANLSLAQATASGTSTSQAVDSIDERMFLISQQTFLSYLFLCLLL